MNKDHQEALFPEILFLANEENEPFIFIISEEQGDKDYIDYTDVQYKISVTPKKENGVLVLYVKIGDDGEPFTVTNPVIEVGNFENEYTCHIF